MHINRKSVAWGTAVALLATVYPAAQALAEGPVYVCSDAGAYGRVVEDQNAYGQSVTIPGCGAMTAPTLSAAYGSLTLQRQAPSNPGDPWAIWQPITVLPSGWSLYTPSGWQTLSQIQAAGVGAAPAAPVVAAPVAPAVPSAPAAPTPASNGAVPGTPSAINATSNTLTLRWGAPNGATGYRLYRDGGLIATLPTGAVTSFIDSGLAPSSTHSYTVSALSGGGESAQSGTMTTSTAAPEPAGGRVVYRFPTNQGRWDEFLQSRDDSVAFPIFGPNPLDVLGFGYGNPQIPGNIAAAHAQGRGLKVLGFINGLYTTAPIGTIKSQIDAWYASNPNLDGIYIGDAGYNPAQYSPDSFLAYWGEIAAYVHQRGGLVMMHGGRPQWDATGAGVYATESDLNRRLLDYYETINVYESYWSSEPYPRTYPFMRDGTSAHGFRFRYSAFPNGVAGYQLAEVVNYLQGQGVGWIYATNVDYDHSVSDGSRDPRDAQNYWTCENGLIAQSVPSVCNGI